MAQKEDFWEVTLMRKENITYYLWFILSEIGRGQKEVNSFSGSRHLIDDKIVYGSKALFFLLLISVK